MKVLHCPTNIAGQATAIARAQRELGVEADVLVFDSKPFNYPCDFDLKLKNTFMGLWPFIIIANFVRCALRYDVFHFYYGRSLLPMNSDLPILKLLGKTTVMQYFGSEVVQKDVALACTNWTKEQIDAIYPKVDDAAVRKRVAWMRKNVSFILSGYPLVPFIGDCKLTYTAVDLSKLQYVGPISKTKEVCIVHAPTRQDIKGSSFILDAVAKLEGEGYKIDFILLEKKTNAEVIVTLKKADIVVDDVMQGPHGALTMESMAMGKPVIDFVHPLFARSYPGLPIVNASPETVYSQIKMLIESPIARKNLGLKGRAYVEEHHDAKKLAKEIIEMYEEAKK